MRIACLIAMVTALSHVYSSPNASARGLFGLFDDARCCDSACCDTPCSACRGETNCCHGNECDLLGDSCRDSGCDGGCGRCDDCLLPSHACGNLFQRDCCSRNYCSLIGGWTGLNDYNGDDSENPIPPPTPAIRRGTFDDGWAIGIAHGRRFNRAVRGELEFAFRSNAADQWFVNGNRAGNWSGHFYSYSLMANLYHDFSSFSLLSWTPYVGTGIGIAFLDGDFQTATLDLEIDDQEFAYQFIVGGSRSLTSNIDLLLEYRYFATTDFELVNNTPVPAAPFGKDTYETNNLFVGLRLLR
jgi:opacity protein-like surface antigen